MASCKLHKYYGVTKNEINEFGRNNKFNRFTKRMRGK